MSVTRWLALMPYTLTVETCSTTDSYGARTYQSCWSARCAVQGPAKFFHSGAQQERVSRQTVIVGSTSAISVLDRVTLPTDFEVRQPPILQVDRFTDRTGIHHMTVYLG